MYNKRIKPKKKKVKGGKLIKTATPSEFIKPIPPKTYTDLKPVFVPVVAWQTTNKL